MRFDSLKTKDVRFVLLGVKFVSCSLDLQLVFEVLSPVVVDLFFVFSDIVTAYL